MFTLFSLWAVLQICLRVRKSSNGSLESKNGSSEPLKCLFSLIFLTEGQIFSHLPERKQNEQSTIIQSPVGDKVQIHQRYQRQFLQYLPFYGECWFHIWISFWPILFG